MPTINHINLGEVQKHVYLLGTISRVHHESDDVAESYWDTADVLLDDDQYIQEHVPIFYHCYDGAVLRDNGAISAGAKGFEVNDKVVVIAEIQTATATGAQRYKNIKVIGHKDGPKKCAYNYVLVRCSLNELEDLALDDITKNIDEYCILFDPLTNELARVVDPSSEAGLEITFPCQVNVLKPFLLVVDLQGVPMWTEYTQGAIQEDFEIAGGIPNWQSDVSGDDIRGTADAKDWWTTYDVNGNPIQNLFEDMYFALMTDDAGSSDGSYSEMMEILAETEEDISTWDDRSKGFVTDKRTYPAPGPVVPPEGLSIPYALGPDGNVLDPATSRHIQTAYGEDEIWMCMVSSYMGLIIEYCDEMWKFSRQPKLWDAIPIPGIIDNWQQVASDAALCATLPSGVATGKLLGDIGMALAADITLSGQGGENNLYSWGTLKRINEGCFHHTRHPAISGSLLLMTTAIPQDTEDLPKYLSAVNLRKEIIKDWFRYDNWNSTYDYLTYSYTTSVSWWFRTGAMQMGCEVIYADTPLGSMWYQSPDWKGFVYLFYGTTSAVMTARQDRAINQDFKKVCKHSANVACQVYVSQRTSLTLWSILSDVFVRQYVGVDPYDTVPTEEGFEPTVYVKLLTYTYQLYSSLSTTEITALEDSTVYVQLSDGTYTKYDTLTEEEKETVDQTAYYRVIDYTYEPKEDLTEEELAARADQVDYGKLADGTYKPYDELTEEEMTEAIDPVAYAKMSDGTYKHYDELTESEIEELVSDRLILYTNSEDATESLRQSRNEIEIMAAVGFYSDLDITHGRKNPADQERSPELEAAIAGLVETVTDTTELKFAPIYIDMEIL